MAKRSVHKPDHEIQAAAWLLVGLLLITITAVGVYLFLVLN